jgi:hypothetical protein
MRKILLFSLMIILSSFVYAGSVELVVNPNIGSEVKYLFPDHNYSASSVSVTYSDADSKYFTGSVHAEGLKPGFTYQLKIWGKPSCLYDSEGNDVANNAIGSKGRWTCIKTATNNCNNCVGASCNRDGGVGNPGECLLGYLVFSYFTTESDGSADLDFQSDTSYHVLWCDKNPVDSLSCSCGATGNVYLSSGLCSSNRVCGQLERGSCGSTSLNVGHYDAIVGLTEESFHQPAGNWATVLFGDVDFDITNGVPSPSYVIRDFFDVGDADSESAHSAYEWGSINSFGGYGGKDSLDDVDDEGVGVAKDMRVVWGGYPITPCTGSNNWASFVMDANGYSADFIELRALDGSSDDSFSLYIVDGSNEVFVGNYTADPSTAEYWQTLGFELPDDPDTGLPYNGMVTFKIYSTGVKGDYCENGFYGQNAFSWIRLSSEYTQQPIPEFSAIASGIAILGAGVGFVLLRRRR